MTNWRVQARCEACFVTFRWIMGHQGLKFSKWTELCGVFDGIGTESLQAVPCSSLAEQLRDPLVRNTTGAEPSSVRRTKIVDVKVSNICPSQRRVPNGLERFLMAVGVFNARDPVIAWP
jgi:hypothetical protein